MRHAQFLTLLACLLLTAPLVSAQISDNGVPIEELSDQQLFERRITPEVQVVDSATPAVVFIETDTQTRVYDMWGRPYAQPGRSSGSGVVLHASGFIVTNYHVVKNATSIRVSFAKWIDDRIYDADLLSFVESEDLALLKIRDAEKEFATVPIGTSSDLMIGERVIAIGNPLGITHTSSVGIISGLHRDIKIGRGSAGVQLHFDDLIQTDASINPGNSGGPLLNINGALIGINNAVNQDAENIGFAIPIDRVYEVLQQQLISPERYNAWLGFNASENDDLEIREVLPSSPADLAGLRDGDRLLALGDQELDSLETYQLARVAMRPGEVTNLRVKRGEKTIALPIQAWDKSDGLIYERLGVRVEQTAIQRQGRMLKLTSVLPDGPAATWGLEQGDIINAMRPQTAGLRQRRAFSFSDRMELAGFLYNLEAETTLDIEIRREGVLYQGTLILN